MTNYNPIKAKVAKALLLQRDPHQRRRQILRYGAILVALLLGHGYFSNLGSGLKLIPQTAAAIGLGYILLTIQSLRRFDHVADFIDWDKVTACAEPSSGANATASHR